MCCVDVQVPTSSGVLYGAVSYEITYLYCSNEVPVCCCGLLSFKSRK